MTFCLYECLRAVGLQQHYARFTSAGVCRAAHLSELTMEDYPHLGICTMEERARLFDLVQMIKSLDLDILGSDEDDNFNSNAAAAQDAESYAVVNGEFNCGDFRNPVDDVGDEEDARLLCIQRRLNFSIDSTDRHQKLSFCPVGSANVHVSHDPSPQHIQGRALAVPVQLHHGNLVVCNCKGNKFKPDADNLPSDHHLEDSFNSAITRGTPMHNSDNILLSRCASFQNPNPRSTIVSSETSTNKTPGPQNRKGISRKQSLRPDMKRTTSFGCMAKPTPVFEVKGAANYNYGLPLKVPVTPSKRRVGEHRITVCVRKRPLTRAENRRKESDVVTAPSGECVIVHESKDAVDLSPYILEHRFYFDHVFDERNSNKDVYQNTAYPLVQHMLNGGNATCFAYGQTGAGKTHTMLGSPPGRPGLYALAVRDIFTHLSATRTHPSLQVFVSFFEIYCGQLYDLLDHRKRLFAREDGQKMVHISGLRHVRVDSVNSLLEVISHGTKTRTQGMSGVNPCSSRSHALLQIQLRNSNQQIAGRMWFVDLAGSERASDTKEPDKQSRMEGAEINQSLLALKECIRALDRDQSHTPFRQSKLTQVLKNAFIGDSMTCMIANISPGHGATEHTLNTLRYADRVKELKGQGGQRGRRGSKTVPSPKHNLSNSNSSRGSVGPRGKSLPEESTFGRQKDSGATSHTTRLFQGNAILCSTPKNSRRSKEANVSDRDGIGLEHLTPIRVWLDVGEKSKESIACGGKKTGVKNRRYSSPSVSKKNYKDGPILGQQIDNQLDSWVLQNERTADRDSLSFTKRQSELNHSEEVNQQFSVKEESGEDRKWIELRRRVESSRDINSKEEKDLKRDFQDFDGSNEERKMHLRRYHEALQKFIPSTSSSFHLETPSPQTSISSSIPLSFLRHSSSLSVSANGCSGPEEYLDTDAVGGEVRAEANRRPFPLTTGEFHSLNESAPVQHYNHSETRCEQVRGESQKKLGGATGDKRVPKRSAGTDIQHRRLAWDATQQKDPVNVTTILTNRKAQVSDGNDSEDRKALGVEIHNASDSPADGMCSAKQEAAAVVSGCGLFSHTLESTPQQAPAERPLSPACEQTNTFSTSGKLSDVCLEFSNVECNSDVLFLPLKHSSEAVPSSRYSENKPCFTTNAKAVNKQSKAPTHNKEPEATVLPQNEADSFSCIMDPLSISLLQVDQQPATPSFLQGDSGSPSRFEDESTEDRTGDVGEGCPTCAEMVGKIAEFEDEDFHLTLLELPKIKSHVPKTSDSRAATIHTAQAEICRLDKVEPLKGSGDFLQHQEHSKKPQTAPALGIKDPASPHKHLTCTSLQTPAKQPAVHNFMDASLLSLHEALTNAREIPSRSPHTSLMSTPQPETISSQLNIVPSQCHAITSDYERHSNISFQPNTTATLLGEEDRSCPKTRSTVHLFTLDDLNHAKWCVIKAHWEQLKEMDALCHKEGLLLHQQPDMGFGEYVHRLEEIMEKKAQCVHSMRAQLQPYLKPIHYNRLEQQQ